MRTDGNTHAGLGLDFLLERIGPGDAAIERHCRHAHHQIIRLGGYDVTHRIEHVFSDHFRARHEGVVTDGLGVRRENAAIVIGDTDRPHHLEIWLYDRIGGWPDHPELPPPTENVSPHR